MFENTVQYSLCDQALTSHQGSFLLPHLPNCAQVRILALSFITYNQATETRLENMGWKQGYFKGLALKQLSLFGLLFQNLSLCEVRCRCTGRAKKNNSLDKVSAVQTRFTSTLEFKGAELRQQCYQNKRQLPFILVVGQSRQMIVNCGIDVQELWVDVRCHEEQCHNLGHDWKLWELEMGLKDR